MFVENPTSALHFCTAIRPRDEIKNGAAGSLGSWFSAFINAENQELIERLLTTTTTTTRSFYNDSCKQVFLDVIEQHHAEFIRIRCLLFSFFALCTDTSR